MRVFCVLLCCSLTATGYAATLNKCDDGQGHVIFTQQACPDGSGGERIKVPPATEGVVIGPPAVEPFASEDAGTPGGLDTSAATGPRPSSGVTVVGADPVSSCGPFTEKEVRAAKVRKEVLPGMRAKDVEGSWGQPSYRTSSRWVYQIDDCLAWFVELDANGCVTGTRKGDNPVGLRCDDLMWKRRQERERRGEPLTP